MIASLQKAPPASNLDGCSSLDRAPSPGPASLTCLPQHMAPATALILDSSIGHQAVQVSQRGFVLHRDIGNVAFGLFLLHAKLVHRAKGAWIFGLVLVPFCQIRHGDVAGELLHVIPANLQIGIKNKAE